jgi:hypothetical protein
MQSAAFRWLVATVQALAAMPVYMYDYPIHCMRSNTTVAIMADDAHVTETGAPEKDPGIERLIAIGRSAGTVAHKVNNHLTSILTFAHLLRDKANMDAQDREDLDLIVREAMQAATMVRNLQDFTREPTL